MYPEEVQEHEPIGWYYGHAYPNARPMWVAVPSPWISGWHDVSNLAEVFFSSIPDGTVGAKVLGGARSHMACTPLLPLSFRPPKEFLGHPTGERRLGPSSRERILVASFRLTPSSGTRIPTARTLFRVGGGDESPASSRPLPPGVATARAWKVCLIQATTSLTSAFTISTP